MLSCAFRPATTPIFRTSPRIPASPNCSIPIPAPMDLPTAILAKKNLSSRPAKSMESRSDEFALLQQTAIGRGLRVVAIGGGTGLSTLLKGLKHYVLSPSEI